MMSDYFLVCDAGCMRKFAVPLKKRFNACAPFSADIGRVQISCKLLLAKKAATSICLCDCSAVRQSEGEHFAEGHAVYSELVIEPLADALGGSSI